MGITNDYRISQIVVLCKDCGQDVGLYPARHKCEVPERPPLPAINLDEINQHEKEKTTRHSPLSPIELEKKLNQSGSSINEQIESPRHSPPPTPVDLEKKLRRNISINGREETSRYAPLAAVNDDRKMRLNGSSSTADRHDEREVITPHSPPSITLDQRMRRTGSTNGREENTRRPVAPINLDKRVKRNISTNGVSRITVDANQWKCVTRSNSATTFNRHRKEQQQHQPREIIDIKSTQQPHLGSSSSPLTHNKDILNEEDDSSSYYYDRFTTDLPQKNPRRFQDRERESMNTQNNNDSKSNKLPWLDNNNNNSKNKNNNDGNSRSLWNKLTGSGKNKLQEGTNRRIGSNTSDREEISHISGVLQDYNEYKREPTSSARFIDGSRDEDYAGRSHSNNNTNEFKSMATATTTIKKKPSLLEQRPSHQRHKKLWEQQEMASQRELEREALRHQVPREETVTRSQTMRQYRSHRDIVEQQPSERRHYYQEEQENYKNNQHHDNTLDSIYGNYLSDNVTRSYSERRPSPTRRMHPNNKNNITPPIMRGYF